jgi:hypothetical protein
MGNLKARISKLWAAAARAPILARGLPTPTARPSCCMSPTQPRSPRRAPLAGRSSCAMSRCRPEESLPADSAPRRALAAAELRTPAGRSFPSAGRSSKRPNVPLV